MVRRMTAGLIFLLAGLALASPGLAREVYVKDWGMVEVDTEHFVDLQDQMKSSSQISRMFYDPTNAYLLVSFQGNFYQYCGITSDTIDTWLAAPSLSQYYLDEVQNNYDCRTNPGPDYRK